MRQDLIEKVKRGEAWIHYGQGEHGTLTQLRAIHKACLPRDTTICSGKHNFYRVVVSKTVYWHFTDTNPDNQPTIKVSEFFHAELTFQRAKVLSGKKESYKYSLTERSLVFWRKPFTPCAEVDVPQTVIEALQSDNSQTIVIGGFIYKI